MIRELLGAGDQIGGLLAGVGDVAALVQQIVGLELTRLGRRRARREGRRQRRRGDQRNAPGSFSAAHGVPPLSPIFSVLSIAFFFFIVSASALLVRALFARRCASAASRFCAWARSLDAVILARIRSACLRVRSSTSRTWSYSCFDRRLQASSNQDLSSVISSPVALISSCRSRFATLTRWVSISCCRSSSSRSRALLPLASRAPDSAAPTPVATASRVGRSSVTSAVPP